MVDEGRAADVRLPEAVASPPAVATRSLQSTFGVESPAAMGEVAQEQKASSTKVGKDVKSSRDAGMVLAGPVDPDLVDDALLANDPAYSSVYAALQQGGGGSAGSVAEKAGSSGVADRSSSSGGGSAPAQAGAPSKCGEAILPSAQMLPPPTSWQLPPSPPLPTRTQSEVLYRRAEREALRKKSIEAKARQQKSQIDTASKYASRLHRSIRVSPLSS